MGIITGILLCEYHELNVVKKCVCIYTHFLWDFPDKVQLPETNSPKCF